VLSLFILPSTRAARSKRDAWGWAASIAAVVALAAFGMLDQNLGLLDIFGTVLMYVVLTQAWNILGGYGGYLNFGMVTYFGVGAYTTALMFHFLDLPPLLTAP